MPPSAELIERLKDKLRLETPIIAVYDAAPDAAFGPMVKAKGHACCFSFYKSWLNGKTLVIERGTGDFAHPENGCPGAQAAFGFAKKSPPFMAHFLTDGVGAPMGEGLKATPELAQEFLDRARPLEISGDTILIGPLLLELWE